MLHEYILYVRAIVQNWLLLVCENTSELSNVLGWEANLGYGPYLVVVLGLPSVYGSQNVLWWPCCQWQVSLSNIVVFIVVKLFCFVLFLDTFKRIFPMDPFYHHFSKAFETFKVGLVLLCTDYSVLTVWLLCRLLKLPRRNKDQEFILLRVAVRYV